MGIDKKNIDIHEILWEMIKTNILAECLILHDLEHILKLSIFFLSDMYI